MKETQEIEVLWRLIANSVERLVECLYGLDADQLNWRPLETANSLYVLATHTMGNVEWNILGVFCDEPVRCDRDSEFLAKGGSPESIPSALARAARPHI